MTPRVKKLRERSLNAVPSITGERAKLITEFYKTLEADRVSPPVQHALAFKHILENKAVVVNEGELIVGERGTGPKATPTYPEVTCHSVEDLRILDSRPKTSFKADAATIRLYEKEIIPFWRGRSIRDRMMAELPREWKDAYEAGVFTEFMEQRAPGHTVLDNKIYRKGMLDFIADIDDTIARLDFLNDPEALDKREELRGMRIAAEALIAFGRRHAVRAKELAAKEKNPARKKELLRIAEVCEWVPARAPRNFWEALQCYWFVHLGVIIEYNTWDSFNPGRLDQHLWPFYENGLAGGTLTEESARELLECFWIKFNNQPA
ncbi:MAG: pyruvate formate lyase family protein, partial [Candidatus Aminicenantales bacterium]